MFRACRALCIAAAVALSPLAARAAAATKPVEAFGNLPAIRDPRLSPDGRYLAAIQDDGGRPAVVIYPIGSSAKPAVFSSSDWVIAGLQWVKADRLVVFLSQGKRLRGPNAPLQTWTRAIAISPQGDKAVALMKDNVWFANNTDAATIADLAPADADHIYMPLAAYDGMRTPYEQQRRLRAGTYDEDLFRYNLMRVDVRNGEDERVSQGDYDTAFWLMDGAGQIRARVDRRTRPDSHMLKVRREDGWADLMTLAPGDAIAGLTVEGAHAVRFTDDKAGFRVMQAVDLKTGALSPVFQAPGVDLAGALKDEWTGRIVGAVYAGDRAEAHYFDPVREALQAKLKRAFPSLAVRIVSQDRSGRLAVVETQDPRHPPSYYILDSQAANATAFLAAYGALAPDDLGEMTPYPYTARDGLKIPAYLTLPPNRSPRGLPLIVMPHGGPDARDMIGFDWLAQFFANRGYAVLQPNFRGSSGYGRAFTEAGFQQWGLKMQDDITDGVRKAIADGIADPKRVCIVGASYGGYAALAGATTTPDLYACVVSLAGISDLPVLIGAEKRNAGRYSESFAYWSRRIGSPVEDSQRLRDTSPARRAGAVRAPVLLLHAEKDATVPIRQSELMAAALQAAGKPVRFVRLPGDDHYLQLGATRIRLLQELDAFLSAHLGA